MKLLNDEEKGPIGELLKNYVIITHKRYVSAQLLAENIKKAYSSGRFGIKELINPTLSNNKTEDSTKQCKSMKELIEQQKRKLKLIKNSKNVGKNTPECRNSAKMPYVTPHKQPPNRHSLSKTSVTIKKKPETTICQSSVRLRNNNKQLNMDYMNMKRSKSEGIIWPKIRVSSRKSSAGDNQSLKKETYKIETISKLLNGIEPVIEEAFKSDYDKLIDDCSEISSCSKKDSSKFISFIDTYNCIDDFNKNDKPNVFETNSTKKLEHILQHGYSYKYEEKKQYKSLRTSKELRKKDNPNIDILNTESFIVPDARLLKQPYGKEAELCSYNIDQNINLGSTHEQQLRPRRRANAE